MFKMKRKNKKGTNHHLWGSTRGPTLSGVFTFLEWPFLELPGTKQKLDNKHMVTALASALHLSPLLALLWAHNCFWSLGAHRGPCVRRQPVQSEKAGLRPPRGARRCENICEQGTCWSVSCLGSVSVTC